MTIGLTTATVEVFRTNVSNREIAQYLIERLNVRFPAYRINFDLQDCDKVLRVEGQDIAPDEISGVVESEGYLCQVLD